MASIVDGLPQHAEGPSRTSCLLFRLTQLCPSAVSSREIKCQAANRQIAVAYSTVGSFDSPDSE